MKLHTSLLALLLAATVHAADDSFKDLFNGKDLTGWTQKGGAAKYEVQGGEIIGNTVPNTPNSFLCTDKEYGNFVLELEFKVQKGLNSGIQFRSRVSDKDTVETFNGKPLKFPAGRVNGPQFEIDTSDRAWTGGVYGEGGWGWLNDLKDNEAARKAFKQDEWNKVRIEANGPSIKTWLNDVPAADLKFEPLQRGFIALQVHGIGKKEEKYEVRWRKVRLKELP